MRFDGVALGCEGGVTVGCTVLEATGLGAVNGVNNDLTRDCQVVRAPGTSPGLAPGGRRDITAPRTIGRVVGSQLPRGEHTSTILYVRCLVATDPR